MVLWHGGSCKEMCGAILWVSKQDGSTTLQSINSMHWWPSFQRRRNENLLENCHKYALKLFWNGYTWHVLEDLIFHGQWTNLHDRSQNGPKLVTNAWIDWYSYFHHTCEYKQYCFVGNTAKQCRLGLFQDSDFAGDLEDSKSTSAGTLCFLEVIHLFQQVGCVRNKLQFDTVQQNPKSSLWTLDWDWTGFPLWDLIVLVRGNTTQNHDRTGQPVVCRGASHAQGQKGHSESQGPMTSLIARAPSNLSSSASEKPGEEKLWKSESLECDCWENMIERGHPLLAVDTSHAPGHYHKQFVESSYSAR